MTDLPYTDFLAAKAQLAAGAGLDVDPAEVHPILKPHQRDAVVWAIRGGRRAIFAAFGLGKSIIQLEVARLALAKLGDGKALIVIPLGVRQEFVRDAGKLDLEVTFIRHTNEAADDGIYLTNYESVRDSRLDPAAFQVASLDEAAVLRSYGSKTYQVFLNLFRQTPYRFLATATPSPNRFKELIHYAGFLGVMDTGQALTRFFQRDSTKANNLTLYSHKEREFWLWVASWALFIQRPSDLGYDDAGYDLPPIEVVYHEISVDHSLATVDRDGQGRLFRGGPLGVSDAAREKRDTLAARVAKAVEIVAASPDDHFILWHDLEDERRAIKAAIPEAVEVFGNLDLEVREQRIIDFSDGKVRLLATKPELSGSGCNFQRHCHRAIFVGVGFGFHDFIQAVHRIHRFLQGKPVRIDIIHAESEREIVRTLQQKWARHEDLTSRMSDIIREHGLSHSTIAAEMTRSIGVQRREASGPGWLAINNDCVDETASMADNSVDLIITSIPFSNHYEYTPSYNDFGHTDDNAHFWAQMDYLTPQLLRVLAPGRIYACHVKDRILFGAVTGAGVPTVSPFHAEAIAHGIKRGFDYMGMITVVTDVVRENNQTYRLGWTEQCRDGTKMGVGSPEYILLFHKPQTDRSKGYADTPVVKDKASYTRARWQTDAHAFWRSSGDRPLTPEELAQLPLDQMSRLFTDNSLRQIYDHEAHIALGEELERQGSLPATFMSLAPGSHHPDVWHDVNRMRTLNGEQARKSLMQHVCLARDSLVLTRGGYKPIQQVQVGELVLTHKGRWRPVLAVQNTGVRPVIQLHAQGVPGLTLTPDHKVWTRDVRRFARKADYARRVEPGWVAAAETVGSYVNRKLPPVEMPGVADLDVWWIVGRWLADGHREAHGGLVISCSELEVDELRARLGRFGGNSFRRAGEHCHQALLRDPDRVLRNITKACGMGAAGKHLPPDAYTLPAEHAKALLDGYLSGDGHFLPERQRWTASSVSRELLLGMASLAQRAYGAAASVYPGRPARRGTIDDREVSMRGDWIFCFDLPDAQRRKKSLVLDDGAWMKVRSAEPAGEVETWNLRVAEDESYTAEGMVVKNCPLQFDIVERLITRYSNPGETVYDPFGGLMTVPYCAVKMGRRGVGVELNPQYFADGVAYVDAAAREMAAPTLFDFVDGGLDGAEAA
ncbi:DNA methyltransferase [Rhizomonospora bruguierae]|uniref:DNA methyltransferase n=1 Tax=Rhizomonospora bruguierae TaxID=1581705 RepID=UPI001BCC4FA5|nr:DNA methyltransferase [Micromonospora sp. NBRC 107566]